MRNKSILFSFAACVFFSAYAYAGEGRIVKGPADTVYDNDYWLSTWEPNIFNGTDAVELRYTTQQNSADDCHVRLERWNEHYGTFVAVRVRIYKNGESFKNPGSPWLFTLTDECELTWENIWEQESFLFPVTFTQG
ncbi:hypothetical protein JXR01_03260 [Candidatus Kaiserbacteria bacterium]|nr:MAG: hypothetical protein JXR01_03260 [Candidatus Kaiserbacteria bacterium]